MRTREKWEHALTLLGGMAVGAALMYVFDQHRGAKRRAQARDKLIHLGHRVGHGLNKHGRDLTNRVAGSLAELRARIRDRGREISDDQLVDRVRAQLGHVASHSGLLQVEATDGCVSVCGPVLDSEVEKITHRLGHVRGVRDYRLDLEPHASLEQVSGRKGMPSRKAI